MSGNDEGDVRGWIDDGRWQDGITNSPLSEAHGIENGVSRRVAASLCERESVCVRASAFPIDRPCVCMTDQSCKSTFTRGFSNTSEWGGKGGECAGVLLSVANAGQC